MDPISYETIRNAHRAEKEEQLQKLPIDFFESVRNWFANKDKQKDTQSLLEVENAKKLLDEIVNRRERKILLSALRTVRGDVPPQNMTIYEKEFFDQAVKILKSFRQNIQEKFISYDTIIESKIEDVKKSIEGVRTRLNGKTIRFLIDLPNIAGIDQKSYGPFRIGDETTVPSEVANNWISKKVAEEVI